VIPLRVYLKNFLCHSDQEFLFDGHTVWLLHGPNGVGKSAVFDAIVYALFGESNRREGCRTAVSDLVRYGESSMRVEFDFEYRGRRYRVWRTRTRSGQPRQGVGEFEDDDTAPRPLRHVNRTEELDQWVCDTLGLGYDAFVSAVLLRQGAAERLIDAKKEARRDLFRGILDLDAYVGLHDAVTAARAGVGGEARALRGAIQEMPEATEEQVAIATAARDNTTASWEIARDQERAARERLTSARLWDGMNETCRTVRRQLDAARDRAARAAELERAVGRLRELRTLLPALSRMTELHTAAEAAETKLARLTELRRGADDRHAELLAAAEQERQKVTEHGNRLAEFDREMGRITGDCGRLREQIQQAEKTADLHRRLDAEKARRFDPDLDEQLAQAERAVTEAQAARDAYPHLETIVRERTAFLQATTVARTAADAEGAATAAAARLRMAEDEAARLALIEAEAAEAAGRAAAVAGDRLTTARELLIQFCADTGEAICSRCRQSIGPEHVERERGELERAVRDAEEDAVRREEEASRAAASAANARRIAREREADRSGAETARDEATRKQRDAEARANAARKLFENARAELTSELAGRVGEIETQGFPSEPDVDQAQDAGRQLPVRTRTRNAVHTQCRDRDAAAEAIRTLTQAVRAVGAPPDVTAARNELADKEQDLAGLNRQRAEAGEARRSAEEAERRLAGQVVQVAGEVNRLATDVGRAGADAENARRAYDDAVLTLPDGATTWKPAVLADERRELEEADVERDFEAIAEDRALHADRERRLAEVDQQIEEQVPPDARRPSAEVEFEVTAAGKAVQEAERARDAARELLAELTRRREQREDTQRRLTEAERDHALHDRLAGLLGPQGIQLDLVRQAERRIIDLANVTLGRVSRGELRFDPPDPAATQPLDLSVRRAGCPGPIPVGNLSGGQRCRVAIALALAVCRFACGEAQPLQSVIIDEAFANLDRDGRMAMIDVLRDGQIAGDMLRRIIVVSHHEDVAAAFPVGYRLEADGGVTRATVFGR
jgi:DNA repair exonuclease SbcCD ATPase subunit